MNTAEDPRIIPGLVSVIIPTYNRARLVGSAVESALSQDYPKTEILVIDDGSSDGTREMMARAYGANPKVRYLPKANGGVSSARNLGIRESRGEYVALLDADDAWLPGKLVLQLECLRRFPEAGMVWTDMAAVDGDGRLLHERYLRTMYSAYEFYPTARELFSNGLQETRIGGTSSYCRGHLLSDGLGQPRSYLDRAPAAGAAEESRILLQRKVHDRRGLPLPPPDLSRGPGRLR